MMASRFGALEAKLQMLVASFVMPLIAWKLDLKMVSPCSEDFCVCSQTCSSPAHKQGLLEGTASRRFCRVLKAATSNECSQRSMTYLWPHEWPSGLQNCHTTCSQQLQTQLAACAGSEAEAWQKLYCRVISHVEWSQASCNCCLRYMLLGDAPTS